MYEAMLGTGRNWSRKSIEDIVISMIEDGSGGEFDGNIWMPACSGTFEVNPNFDKTQPVDDNNQPSRYTNEFENGLGVPFDYMVMDEETGQFSTNPAFCVIGSMDALPDPDQTQHPFPPAFSRIAWRDIKSGSLPSTAWGPTMIGTVSYMPGMTPNEHDNIICFNFEYGQFFYCIPDGDKVAWIECTDTNNRYSDLHQYHTLYKAVPNGTGYKEQKFYNQTTVFKWEVIRQLLVDCGGRDYQSIICFAFTQNITIDHDKWVKPFEVTDVHNATGGQPHT